ncbi:hypothetical protein ABBQ32_008581 [Trebouxia sp. C0010 RCD-2024]
MSEMPAWFLTAALSWEYKDLMQSSIGPRMPTFSNTCHSTDYYPTAQHGRRPTTRFVVSTLFCLTTWCTVCRNAARLPCEPVADSSVLDVSCPHSPGGRLIARNLNQTLTAHPTT